MEKDGSDVFIGRVACRYVRALVIRLTFLIHSLLTLWRVYLLRGNDMYWSFAALLILLPLETIITLKVKKGGEWAWFCPSFFFYLLSVLPSIWLLELDRLHRHRDDVANVTSLTNLLKQELMNNSASNVRLSNLSTPTVGNYTILNSGNIKVEYKFIPTLNEKELNATMRNSSYFDSWLEIVGNMATTAEANVTQSGEGNISLTTAQPTVELQDVNNILPQIVLWLNSGVLDPDTWVIALEQSMLYLLILGRWFLPRGKMTHDQLSQLLFVYIGMSSDIMELFYLFDEKAVVKDGIVGYIILTAWSVSLLQFTLILTAVSAKKRKVTHSMDNFLGKMQKGCTCTHNEIWAILVTVCLQDAPFLSIRLYVAIGLKVITYSLIFFTVKNVLVILLQIYRLAVVGCHEDEHKKAAVNFEMASSNGKKKQKVIEDGEMYDSFYDDPEIAASNKLKVGVAPLASSERLFS